PLDSTPGTPWAEWARAPRGARPSRGLRRAALAAPLDVVAHALAGLPVAPLHLGLDAQARHGRGPAVFAERHEADVADGAQAPLAGERVLAVHLAAHDHAGAPRPRDAAP